MVEEGGPGSIHRRSERGPGGLPSIRTKKPRPYGQGKGCATSFSGFARGGNGFVPSWFQQGRSRKRHVCPSGRGLCDSPGREGLSLSAITRAAHSVRLAAAVLASLAVFAVAAPASAAPPQERAAAETRLSEVRDQVEELRDELADYGERGEAALEDLPEAQRDTLEAGDRVKRVISDIEQGRAARKRQLRAVSRAGETAQAAAQRAARADEEVEETARRALDASRSTGSAVVTAPSPDQALDRVRAEQDLARARAETLGRAAEQRSRSAWNSRLSTEFTPGPTAWAGVRRPVGPRPRSPSDSSVGRARPTNASDVGRLPLTTSSDTRRSRQTRQSALEGERLQRAKEGVRGSGESCLTAPTNGAQVCRAERVSSVGRVRLTSSGASDGRREPRMASTAQVSPGIGAIGHRLTPSASDRRVGLV